MIIWGEWVKTEDGRILPAVRGKVLTARGDYFKTVFHIDSGADCTVFTPGTIAQLGYQPAPNIQSIAGVGGAAATGTVDSKILLKREDGTDITVNGPFAAVFDPAALDMDILGRDILYYFAVILDRPNGIVCLIRESHRYRIEEF